MNVEKILLILGHDFLDFKKQTEENQKNLVASMGRLEMQMGQMVERLKKLNQKGGFPYNREESTE